MRFSANLGFLWTELSLPGAIRAAHRAGFDAVECHAPDGAPVEKVKAALEETGLDMLGINTRPGDRMAGENGLAALPGREGDARQLIDLAIDQAVAIGADSVHVMAGRSEGTVARATFVGNLRYAAERAQDHGLTILIETLNRHDAPGYFLQTTDQAREILDTVGRDNVRLMFDCYHVGRTEGDIATRLAELLPLIGHIQFAGVPDRGRPDRGEVDFAAIFAVIESLGWTRPLGAEYRPEGRTEASLGWMETLRP